MRDGGAAPRADADLPGAPAYMQGAHALHFGAVPDRLQRLLAQIAQRRTIQHVALATRIHVAVLLHVHRSAPEVMARMLPLFGGVTGVGTHQVGLVGLDAHLVDARQMPPKADEIVHLGRIALHAYHLHHYLQLRAPLLLQTGEADEVIAHFFEL